VTDVLAGWSQDQFTYDGITHDTYRKGTGPGVVVIHEMPGLTPKVTAFGEEVVAAGFTVVMPSLFGTPGRAPSGPYVVRSLVGGCVSRQFASWAIGRTSKATVWCRALARSLHEELGGPGVGAVGMCFTGGFALAMMVDEHTVAPVLSQPSLPLPLGARRGADLNLSPADLDAVVARQDCPVMGLRYTGDRAVGTRFNTLQQLLGDRFIAVEFSSGSSRDHSVLTEHRQEEAVQRVLSFFHERLDG
jgi:dienelactone hydrolase